MERMTHGVSKGTTVDAVGSLSDPTLFLDLVFGLLMDISIIRPYMGVDRGGLGGALAPPKFLD